MVDDVLNDKGRARLTAILTALRGRKAVILDYQDEPVGNPDRPDGRRTITITYQDAREEARDE